MYDFVMYFAQMPSRIMSAQKSSIIWWMQFIYTHSNQKKIETKAFHNNSKNGVKGRINKNSESLADVCEYWRLHSNDYVISIYFDIVHSVRLRASWRRVRQYYSLFWLRCAVDFSLTLAQRCYYQFYEKQKSGENYSVFFLLCRLLLML